MSIYPLLQAAAEPHVGFFCPQSLKAVILFFSFGFVFFSNVCFIATKVLIFIHCTSTRNNCVM